MRKLMENTHTHKEKKEERKKNIYHESKTWNKLEDLLLPIFPGEDKHIMMMV